MSALFLVTGFEPFGEHQRNASWDALELARQRWPSDIITRCLPVHAAVAHELLRRAVDELAPRAVLCTGLGKGRTFRMEKRARRPPELRFEPGGDDVEGRWPWHEMSDALAAVGASTVSSDDAGRYVCESTYWSLLTYQRGRYSPQFAAFLHVPPASAEQPIDHIAAAIESVVLSRHAALRAAPPQTRDPSCEGP